MGEVIALRNCLYCDEAITNVWLEVTVIQFSDDYPQIPSRDVEGVFCDHECLHGFYSGDFFGDAA